MNASSNKFFMLGTEGTGKYIVLVAGKRGRLGFRPISGGFRVRLEPATNEFPLVYSMKENIPGWGKQPMDDGQLRFSVEVDSDSVKDALRDGLEALAETVEINPAAPEWAKELVDGYEAPPVAAPAVAAAADSTNAALIAVLATMMTEMTKVVASLIKK
jgi:hypothetical protein